MKNRWLSILIATLTVSICHAAPPNVLFIVIDDLNDWVGCLDSHPQVKTPNIDALADRGTLFSNAHCQAPICNPSRTSVMTGLRPSTTGVYGLAPWFRTVDELKDLVTLPQHFSNAGYKTSTVGKIYHGRNWNSLGVKEFDVVGKTDPGLRPKEKRVATPRGGNGMDWAVYPFKDSDHKDWKTASWAVEQLDKKPEDPFFMAVGFSLPHVPLLATQKWFDMYPEDEVILPRMLLDDRKDTPRFSWYLHWKLPEPRQKFLLQAGEQMKIVQAYLASVSFIDSQVGRVLDALERNNLADNTIVVLWSDHGYHLGEKQITGKNTLWDRSARVPLIFAGPGVKSGQNSPRAVELLDMYPTLSELCGLEIPEHLEGLSLIPQLKDANASRTRPAITTDNHDNHGVRTEKWRYIQYADGSEELYDMINDPNEFTNLAADTRYAKEKLALRKQLPKINKKPVPGSAKRILIYENGVANWEGEDIDPNEAIPD
ncbi:MAG: choline-sulfatase [Blastopirellula sp.]|nr:MAG: choline-sulfatase [Blastopirellula sp.]